MAVMTSYRPARRPRPFGPVPSQIPVPVPAPAPAARP